MKRIMIVAFLSGLSLSVNADSNGCDFSVDYNININEQQIRFDRKSGEEIIFRENELLVNGALLSLNREQLAASQAFQQQTRMIVPKVADIAIDGAEIGVKAATIALTGLFGNSDDVQKDLLGPIEAISEKIRTHVSATSLNTEALDKEFDEDLNSEIEALVEKAMTKYSGKIFSQVLGSIFSGDSEEMADFEFRMETMKYDMERYVEKNAEELEVKINTLCSDLELIAKLDHQLEGVVDYPSDGIIQENRKEGFRLSSLSFNQTE